MNLLTRRADFRPTTADAEDLTCEVVWSTGADVPRTDRIGPYIERLTMTTAAVDLTRIVGAPLLNCHHQRDLGDVLGVINAASVDGSQGVATVKFSQRAKSIFDDVAAGIVPQVSCGYHVSEWTAANEGGTRVRIATRWMPLELSLVPLAADHGAFVRGYPMDETNTDPAVATREATDSEIRRLCAMGGADAEPIIELQGTVEDARRAALNALVVRAGPETRPAVAVMHSSYDDPHERAAAYSDALLTRIDPAHQPGDRSRQYCAMTLREMAADCLRHAGVRTTGQGSDSIVTRALHTTSDFPLIMGSTIGRVLLNSYAVPPSGVRSLARQTTVADFQAKTYLALGDALQLEVVNEAGEFKSGVSPKLRAAAFRLQPSARSSATPDRRW